MVRTISCDERGTARYQNALKRFPRCIGGLDPLGHDSVYELRRLVQLQIDLFEDREESDIKNDSQLRQCREFMADTERN